MLHELLKAKIFNDLLDHFREAGKPCESLDELVCEMLEDVYEIWLDTHKHIPCEVCEDYE